MKQKKALAIAAASLLIASFSTITANASHSWGSYHWARTKNPFTLKLGNSLTGSWSTYLTTTSSNSSPGWGQSTVLDITMVNGAFLSKCGAVSGRVEVCNGSYGNNGWLGLASISVSGSHIVRGTVKVNDTYFNTSKYNTAPWKNMVMCQEVGHTLGLDHQDTSQTNQNLGTCMDYTSDPAGTAKTNGTMSNEYPNQGDYDQLLCIYDSPTAKRSLSTSLHSCTGTGHLDLTTTLASTTLTVPNSANANSEDPSTWGKAIGSKDSRGRSSQYEKDLGNGEKLITFVIWTD